METDLCRAWATVLPIAEPAERHHCTLPRGHLTDFHQCDCGEEWETFVMTERGEVRVTSMETVVPPNNGGERQCKGCGQPLPWSTKRGRPPSYCAQCRPVRAVASL